MSNDQSKMTVPAPAEVAAAPPAPRVFHLSEEGVMKVMKRVNKEGKYIEALGRHLDKAALKRLSANGALPREVYVLDDREGLTAHHLVPYSEEYRRFWGNQPVYGNLVFCYGSEKTKGWRAVPEAQRSDPETVVF